VSCETDDDSGGDITSVSASTGLSGGATSGDATLSADTSYLQRRVSSSCTVGSSIRVIDSDGTVTCENDRRPVVASSTVSSDSDLASSCANYTGGTVTVNATGAGTVVVEANVRVMLYHTEGTMDRLFLAIGTDATDCSADADAVVWDIPSGYSSATGLYAFMVQKILSIPSPGSYTYYLNGYMSTGYSVGTDTFWRANIVAVFYPD